MIRVGITELKNQLSKYLRLARQGEVIEVLDRSVPVARLEAIREPRAGEGTDRERLIRDGIVCAARARPDCELLDAKPVPCAADAVRRLIEERGAR